MTNLRSVFYWPMSVAIDKQQLQLASNWYRIEYQYKSDDRSCHASLVAKCFHKLMWAMNTSWLPQALKKTLKA